MIEKIKKYRHVIYITIGVLLILAGTINNLVPVFASNQDGMTGSYRLVEKVLPAGAIQPVLSNLPNSDEPKHLSILDENSFSNYSYFIHPKSDRSLEIPLIPDKIEIPSIGLSAPVKIAEFNFTDLEGETFGQWIPQEEFAAAWHPDSALLGAIGNTVINGHHNEFGKVFGGLVDLKSGDFIYIYARGRKFVFVVANKLTLLERGQSMEIRTKNAEWLGKTDDQRLTLVTCWPANSNTHRLIIVARPY